MIDFKQDFPIFETQKQNFTYLDSAATSLKPQRVMQAVNSYYYRLSAPVHRSAYYTADKATELYEEARVLVSKFIRAKSPHEIVFTKNTNEGINLIVNNYRDTLTSRDIVVLSITEHHANIVPWLKLQQELKFEIKYLDFGKDYKLQYKEIAKWPLKEQDRIRVVSLTHASNILGTINPIKNIIEFIKDLTPNSVVEFIVDGAQAVPHIPVNVRDLDCDYYVFSSHKMLGPSGVGVLYAKKEVLDMTEPLLWGSHIVTFVTKDNFQIHDDESGFEAGTPAIEGVIGLGAAIEYLEDIRGDIMFNENTLTGYALRRLKEIKGLTLYGSEDIEDRLGIFSFNIGDVHPHDVAEVLGRRNVCVRSGHHCAMPLLARLNIDTVSCVRASIYLYNTLADIDRLVDGIEEVKKVFKI